MASPVSQTANRKGPREYAKSATEQSDKSIVTGYEIQNPLSTKLATDAGIRPDEIKEPQSANPKFAVFVAHGMGQQIAFQTIDRISEGLRREDAALYGAKLSDLPKPVARTVNVNGDRLQRIELRLRTSDGQEREAHIYEGYWAPLTEGRVNLRDVIAFLLNAAYNGLGLASRPFKRWIFGEYRPFPTPIRAAVYLIVALMVVASLIVMNLAVVTAAGARSLLSAAPGWLSRGLLADLSTTFNIWLTVVTAFAACLVLSISARRTARGKWIRKIMGGPSIALFFLTLVATVMAGVSTLLLFYGHVNWLKGDGQATELWKKVLGGDFISSFNNIFELAVVYLLAAAAILFLLFWAVKILTASVREALSRKPGSLFTLLSVAGLFALVLVVSGQAFLFAQLGKSMGAEHSIWELRRDISWPLLIVISAYVRILFIEHVGDLAAYITPHRLDRFNELREKIKQCVLKSARAIYAARRPDDSGYAYDGVIMVGHSLGSVVIYDALNRLINDDRTSAPNAGDALNALGRTKLFLTFGSPLDKTAFLFALQRNKTSEAREALAATIQPLVQCYEFRTFKWVNIYSPWDIISGSLDFYDPPGSVHPHRVDNRLDEEATTLLAAHVEYWQNRELFKTLHQVLTA